MTVLESGTGTGVVRYCLAVLEWTKRQGRNELLSSGTVIGGYGVVAGSEGSTQVKFGGLGTRLKRGRNENGA